MQEKTLPNQANSTFNIHSGEFGSVSYDIFGSPYQKSGSFLANDSLDFGYLGKPYNGDTELYDYGFRDYSPEIARFTTVDPIRDGRNWYCYVVNDPVNYVDLWGLYKIISKDSLAYIQVENGDSLWSIVAGQSPHATDSEILERISDIVEINGLSNPDLISPGDELLAPDSVVPDITTDLMDKMKTNSEDKKINNPF